MDLKRFNLVMVGKICVRVRIDYFINIVRSSSKNFLTLSLIEFCHKCDNSCNV